MSVKLPSIPPIRGKGITPELSRILIPIKTILENLSVTRGNNLTAIRQDNLGAKVQAEISTGAVDVGASSTGIPFPIDLATSSEVRGVSLTWTIPSYGNHAFCEIYRHTSNNRASGALLATTPGSTFLDTTAAAGTTYYYWVRNKSSGGVYSEFNAGPTAGVSGALGKVTSDDIEVGAALIEVGTGLPGSGLFDGRIVYIPGESLNGYDGTGAQWDTWPLPDTLPQPTISYAYDATATISTGSYETVASATIDVGTGSTKLTTVMINVSCILTSAAAADTTLDIQTTYNGTAVQEDTGVLAADNTATVNRLYTRTMAVTVGAETGSITVALQGKKIGTDNTDITATWITVSGV